MTSAVPPQLTAHPLLSQHPLTPETHATLQSRRAPRPVPQFTRQDSHTTTDPHQKESLSVPHPCVLFSSSPYLRYILGEKILNVNPKLTFSSQLFISGNRANVSFPGIKIPGNRPKARLPARRSCCTTPQKAQGVCRGARLCGPPLRFYLTTRTLYIPSISLSSSSALAEAALSRSIRV